MLDYIDRLVFSTANDAIKHELGLSDATIGLLGGTSFALLYAVMVIPFALVADRGFAARLASAGIAIWSIATALVGRAHGVASIACGRIGVGLGQAAFSPTSSSLTAAYSTEASRATAFSVTYGISTLGYVIGLAGGGWMVGHLGWRETFILLGLAGLPVALLMALFVREPQAASGGLQPGSWRELLANRDLRDLLLYGLTSQIVNYGITLWSVSFYMRSFGLSAAQAGLWFGLGIGLAYMAGSFAGGPLAERMTRGRGMGGILRFAFWAYLLAQPLGVVQMATHSLALSLTMLVGTATISSLAVGPAYGAVPSVVPPERRATASALFSLACNAAGIAIGPPLFGWISDLLTPHFGEGALRVSLLVASILSFWPAVHLFVLQRRLNAGSGAPRPALKNVLR